MFFDKNRNQLFSNIDYKNKELLHNLEHKSRTFQTFYDIMLKLGFEKTDVYIRYSL